MTACHCKRCGIVTKHRECLGSDTLGTKGRFYCEVCGMERWYAKRFGAGDFPELTFEENEMIHEARSCGFAICFPSYPTAKNQAEMTLKAAREHLAVMK